jgi:acetate kinase
VIAFVVNSGSSSIKWELLDAESGERMRGGIVERIGENGVDHAGAMRAILGELGGAHPAVIGHRVVHGGALFSSATLVTDEVESAIEELSALAPLHNPPNLLGIRAAREAFPGIPNVAVFDTAFHQGIPPAAYTYAIDTGVAAEHGIRRYGFHGTSYQYVSRRAAEELDRPLDELRMIVLHLGNGASACAIAGGRSVDTSMGLTPLEGLVMGTRSGDIDAGILFHLGRAGYSLEELDSLLNRRSGLTGLAGSNDMRDVLAGVDAGDEASILAFDVYVHRLRRYVGAYLATLGGADAIVFTAGVGENAAPVRAAVLDGMQWAGIRVDATRNESRSTGGGAMTISADDSAVAVLVVPTNEELEIARQAAAFA